MPSWRGLRARREQGRRHSLTAVLTGAVLLSCPVVGWAQGVLPPEATPPTEQQQAPLAGGPEVEAAPAPVLLGGEVVVWIVSGVGPYTPQVRAERITERLEAIVHDNTIRDPTVTVTESSDSSELRVQQQFLMAVTARDARITGVSRQVWATEAARLFEAAIRAERLRHAPATLIQSGIYGAIATVVLAVEIWLIVLLTRWTRRRVAQWRTRWLRALRVQEAESGPAERLTRLIDGLNTLARFLLVLLALDVYLTFVLGLFPWTRAVSLALLGYVLAPIEAVATSFLGYLPSLLFVIVIAAVIYTANRLVGAFFSQVEHGHIVFPNFPAEWAEPTRKIVRVLLIAFGMVVVFPYLPASDSPAFTGVSVFIGVLISLSSSSALANVIAGLVMVYTSAFRLGDRVKVGDAFGDIVETSLLATRIRTIKNEEITIPNAIVLNTAVTNYSREAKTRGLILHTSVTIGYDAPWRTIHDLLVEAALATPGVLQEPAPFVWQTALNDFYVTYEINAYTRDAQGMVDIYAALHARIQDAFYAAGVEIMSPHFTSLRDGNAVAIPQAFRAPGYEAPGFRVDAAVATVDAAGRPPADARSSRLPSMSTEQGPRR